MGNRAAQCRRDLSNPVVALLGLGLSLVSWESIMPDLSCDPAPLSDAVTDDIRVEVMSSYSPENSRPLPGEWVFQYTVRITNQGRETVQLLSRHWLITDAADHTEEVRGAGVVGEPWW